MFQSSEFRFNFDGGDRLIKVLSGNSHALDGTFRAWAAMYSSAMRRKYKENSRGGGDWPDLADSTKAARARKAGADKDNIEGNVKTGFKKRFTS